MTGSDGGSRRRPAATSILPQFRAAKRLAGALAIALLCGCVTLTVEPRAVVSGPGGTTRITTLSCGDAGRVRQAPDRRDGVKSVDPRSLRLLTWNIHKEGDSGWQRDLSTFAAASDVVLLQETVLGPALRGILGDAGLSWVMASSFVFEDNDVGVLTATRIEPLASCTQRTVEPLIRIPKSAVISWLPIASDPGDLPTGTRETLAVVNIHSINFELSTDAYRAQLEALADALAGHRGPIIFAGDFNTWNDARDRVVADIAARLGLTELALRVDQRAVFFGRHLDHIFIRGLHIIDAGAVPVSSSDHNPVAATLRFP
jgi:endonuclease/exonuclease/phosphatase (EEP) superfamily protein YafD